MRLKRLVHSVWEAFNRLQAQRAEQRLLRMDLRQLRGMVPFRPAVVRTTIDAGWIHRKRPGLGASTVRRCS
jgi:hypothetical protein